MTAGGEAREHLAGQTAQFRQADKTTDLQNENKSQTNMACFEKHPRQKKKQCLSDVNFKDRSGPHALLLSGEGNDAVSWRRRRLLFLGRPAVIGATRAGCPGERERARGGRRQRDCGRATVQVARAVKKNSIDPSRLANQHLSR